MLVRFIHCFFDCFDCFKNVLESIDADGLATCLLCPFNLMLNAAEVTNQSTVAVRPLVVVVREGEFFLCSGGGHGCIVSCWRVKVKGRRKIYLRAVGDGNDSHPPEHHLIDSFADVWQSLFVQYLQVS